MQYQYILSLKDLNLCKKKNSKSNQLAFGIMLGYFKEHIQFPYCKEFSISAQLILQISKDLEIDPMHIATFDWDGRTAERYRQTIREYLGYRVSNIQDIELAINYLVDNVIPRYHPDSVIIEQLRLYFVKNRIEIVSTKQLESYILSAKQQFEQQLFSKIFNNLTQENLLLIDLVLDKGSAEDNGVIELSELKKDIAGAKIKNIQYAIDKIKLLSKLNLAESIFESLDRKLLLKYYDRVMAFVPSNILECTPIVKYATMAIFFHVRLELLLAYRQHSC